MTDRYEEGIREGLRIAAENCRFLARSHGTDDGLAMLHCADVIEDLSKARECLLTMPDPPDDLASIAMVAIGGGVKP